LASFCVARPGKRANYMNAGAFCSVPICIAIHKDADVGNFLRDNQSRVEAIFVQALRRGQKQGELSPKEDTTALGRFFVVTIQGMRAMARLKSDRKALEQVAKVALSVFN
jgi:hypothetical protein